MPIIRIRKNRNDVGKDDGDHATSTADADVELQKRRDIDQVGQVGRRRARTAVRGHEDFGEDRQQEDSLDQDHHSDRPRQVRQHDEPEPVDPACAVHFGGFELFLVERLQSR